MRGNLSCTVLRGESDSNVADLLDQTLENKQRFISQIMTSKTPARKCEDVDQQALTYSEIKALCTGDERIKEKLMLENDVKELRVLAAEHRNTVFEMEDRIAKFPELEQRLTAILDDLHTDREALRLILSVNCPYSRSSLVRLSTPTEKKRLRLWKMRYWLSSMPIHL